MSQKIFSTLSVITVFLVLTLGVLFLLSTPGVHAQGGITPTLTAPRPTATCTPDQPCYTPPPGPSPTYSSGNETKGSIRGTVYNDENADGSCSDDPVMAGVPIKFVNDRGDTSVYLQSGQNGTYGLVAAGLGQWTVTAEPGAGLIVTSQNPVQVFIDVHNPLALNVNFCVSANVPVPDIDPGGGPSGPRPVKPTVILPTAGAGIAPTLIVSGLTGASLILAGYGIEMRRRRENDRLTKKKNRKPENEA